MRGSRLVDFTISLGDAVCVPRSLTDNQVTCQPPTSTPTKFASDTFCHADTMSLQASTSPYVSHCQRPRVLLVVTFKFILRAYCSYIVTGFLRTKRFYRENLV